MAKTKRKKPKLKAGDEVLVPGEIIQMNSDKVTALVWVDNSSAYVQVWISSLRPLTAREKGGSDE